MEAAICTLVSQFKTFAGSDGSSSTLSKEEFQKLVTSQLPNFVKVDPQGDLLMSQAGSCRAHFLLCALLWLNVLCCWGLVGLKDPQNPPCSVPLCSDPVKQVDSLNA